MLLIAVLTWLWMGGGHAGPAAPGAPGHAVHSGAAHAWAAAPHWPWIDDVSLPSCTVRRAYRSDGVDVAEVTLRTSLRWHGAPVDIFAYVCHPLGRSEDRLPGLMVVHGGGSTAGLADALRWARRGYVVVSLDLPGRGQGRAGSRSTGPDMEVRNLLETTPANDNYLVYAVASVRQALTFLAQQPHVDAHRLGIIGVSWGGCITLLVNGQDSRLKAAVNVFGAGYIPESCTWDKWFNRMTAWQRTLWDTRIDPSNFLATQHAPILFVSGTNDHCYYLPIFQKSFFDVKADKRLALIANQRHDFTAAGQKLASVWLQQVLEDRESFPVVTASAPREVGGKLVMTAWSKTARVGTLYCSAGGPQQWTTRHWDAIEGVRVGDHFEFSIDPARVNPELVYFVNVEDASGALTSTPVRSLFHLKLRNRVAYAVSAPIQHTFRREKPFTVLGHDEMVRQRAKSGGPQS